MTTRFSLKWIVSLAMAMMSVGAAAQVAPQASNTKNEIFDPTALDTSVNPCTDFYQYACGSWLKNTVLPSDQSSWARSFSVVYDQNIKTLNTVLSDYSKGKYNPPTPYQKKLGDFYASCMDVPQVEKDSPAALASQLVQIDKITNMDQLATAVGRLHLEGMSVFFSFGAEGDQKIPTLEIGYVGQGGMGLPDSTFYTKTDAASVTLRQKYQTHIAKMFALAGYNNADASLAAMDVLAVENQLASQALPPEDLQDPTKLYHPGNVKALAATAPDFNWAKYFKALQIKTPQTVDVTEPKFMATMSGVLKNSDLGRLRTYLKWHIIESLAPTLGEGLYPEWFSFNGMTLSGQKKPSPRWKRCVNAVSGDMGEALGQAFVAKTFSPQAKQKAIALISKLRQAFEQDLQTLLWLDEPTRLAAIAKLNLITQKIGYPDNWRNYDKLPISGSYWKNVIQANIFESHRVLGKIGGQVDPAEWGMSPQTVNAYYDPNLNQINFPAGILQAPFFSEQANDAQNYGAIGMVIGHEMTHGFDTTGSQFDGHGVQRDWWTPEVKALFTEKAECLINQYSQYSPLPGINVNGKLTVTENIADQGGLKLAYAAYKLAEAGQPSQALVSGLTGSQQFFVSMAQLWCQKQSDEGLKKQVSGDPHSPAKFRVIGTVVNSPDFASAFSCSAGSPMAPQSRCSIW